VIKANAENANPVIIADLQMVFIALSNSVFRLFRNEARLDAIFVSSRSVTAPPGVTLQFVGSDRKTSNALCLGCMHQAESR
jgi:hypothetical protein